MGDDFDSTRGERNKIINVQEISKQFANIFKKRNWKWGTGKEAYIPRRSDIQMTIKELKDDLKVFGVNESYAGRIKISKMGTRTFVSIENGPTLELGSRSTKKPTR